MRFFTSARERRYWLYAVIAVFTIYASLSLAQIVAAELRSRDLLGVAFGLGFGLVMAAVIFQAFKLRPGGLEIGVGIGITAVYMISMTRVATPEERTHLIEYAVVALFIDEALTERARNGVRVPMLALTAILMTTLISVGDELIQLALPGRVFDPADILFNFLAGVMAVGGKGALAWARAAGGRIRHREPPN